MDFIKQVGRGKSVVTHQKGQHFHSFIKEFGQIMNYTSLYSNPTANKDVWGALIYKNPALNKYVLYQNPFEIKM